MLSLVHLSDTHVEFNTKDSNINKHLFERMDNLMNFCDTKFLNTQYIITGDMINTGHKDHYDIFYKMLSDRGLKDCSMIVPGNHDVLDLGIDTIGHDFHPDSCSRFYALQLELLTNNKFNELSQNLKILSTKTTFENTKLHKQTIITSIPSEKVSFILLDSNMLSDYIGNFARGELGNETLKFLKTILKATPDDWVKVIMLHHHPIFNNYFQLMCDSDEFIKSIWDVPNILVLFGHKHNYMLQSSHYGLISSAESTRKTDGKLKFNTFIIDNGKLTWETCKID